MIKEVALKAGIEMHWYNPAQSADARFYRQLIYHGVDTVLDVGANVGGYATYIRHLGFKGNILSFEPLSTAHGKLTQVATGDPKWHVLPRMVLGNSDGEITINIAGNSTSSSVLPMNNLHKNAAPQSVYIGDEKVPIQRLDDITHPAVSIAESIFLKIDTQGYEMPVLEGSVQLLKQIRGVQVELSLAPLYAGQQLYRDVIEWLFDHGFEMWNIIPGFTDQNSGRMLQFDGVFFKQI